jgi:hypothetical protein
VLFPSIGQLFSLARETQDLFLLQAKTKEALLALDERMRGIEARVSRLEGEQGQIVSEAKGAATAAATIIAGAVIADAVTRVTRVEERLGRLEPWPQLGDSRAGR